MKLSERAENVLPPILKEYILAMFNTKNNNVHVRQNYRDNLDFIRSVCEEAVRKFDKDTKVAVSNTRKSNIRSAHVE